MKRKLMLLSIVLLCFMGPSTSCSILAPPDEEAVAPDVAQAAPPAPIQEVPEDEAADEVKFSTMESAYYSKYTELAQKYGTHCLHDNYIDSSTEYSYLGGVCIVNLMDFNMDGVKDLFVVYSNGQMDKVTEAGSSLEIYDLPSKDTYELEIWTYKAGGLSEILHESSVSFCYTYPNDKSDFFQKYYKNFITVYEKKDGFPLIQIYAETYEQRRYTNIYYSDGHIVKDELLYNYKDDTLQKNGLEITENIWSENVAAYQKNNIVLISGRFQLFKFISSGLV